MNAVFTFSESRLGSRLVMLAIADNADDHGVAWPGVKRLAEKAKMSERAVQYAFEDLSGLGELVIHLRRSPYGTNLYVIRLPGLLPVESGVTQILHHLKTRSP